MSSWSKLPGEILNIIFLYLNNNKESNNRKNDVSQCTLTCSNWKDTAQTILFSDVVIQAQEINNSLNCLIMVNHSLRKLVKSFEIIGTLDELTIPATLLAIDTQFPNIERFNFYPPLADNLYSCFTKMITEKELFKNLRSIPVPTTTATYKLYMECVNFLKDSVKTIELLYSNMVQGFSYRFIVFLRENINQFPNLKKIGIHTIIDSSNNDTYTQQFIDELGSIIEGSLEPFQQLLIILYKHGQQYLRLRFSRQDSLCITVYNGANFFELPNKIMVLIMNRFSNLKHISFKRFNSNDKNYVAATLQPRLSEVALQFAYYLFKKVSNFCVSNITVETQSAVRLIKHIYDDNSKHNSAQPTVSSTVGLTTSKLYDHFWQAPLNEYASFISFTKYEHKINMTTFFDIEDYNNSNNQMQLKFIQQTGCFTSKMYLQVFRNTDLDVLLNCVADYSTRLVRLGISGFVNLSLKSNIKKSGKGENMIRTCKTVTMLHLYDCIPKPDNFVRILKHFPSLKILLLKNCFLQNSWCGGERYFYIYLPNATLDSLEIFMDEDFYFNLYESGFYYIKLVTDDAGNKDRYYCFKENYRNNKSITEYSIVALENVTESDFQESIIDPVKSSCVIYCKSLHALYIHYVAEEDGQTKTVRLF